MSGTHHEESFIRKYIFSVDHKVIGIQYGITSLFFLLLGFSLMMVMRWQLAYPDTAVPIVGPLLTWLADLNGYSSPNGSLPSDLYNSFGAMHGTIMVFLGVVPIVVGAFGNYLVPLQIGTIDMAFPKLNMASYWCYLAGGLIMIASFFMPGGAANSGWTSYPPLSDIATMGQTFWLLGMIYLITSSLLGSINIIVTIVQLRADGLTWFKLPIFVWAQLVTSFLLVLAFPPLEVAGILQLMDRLVGTSFFLPAGLVVTDQLLTGPATLYSGGGSPLLWQHLFWFLAHPEVYVLILPAMGIVAEIVANNIRKPLWGYNILVYSLIFLGFMSFIVWAHHMFLTGMGQGMSIFFAITTMIISVPSVVILTCLLLSLWGGSIRFNTPMLFAISFIPMFGIGGLTGLPLGLPSSDIPLHDTYYVIGHFHYVVAPGTIFAIFAGIYFWFPKVTGKMLNETLGKLHFWSSFIFMQGIFMPMFLQGLAGVSRRLADGGASYAHAQDVIQYNEFMSVSSWWLGVAQLFFIVNIIMTLFKKKEDNIDPNPWRATTFEWTDAPSPPIGHGNFENVPVAYRGPYEYSVPGEDKDFTPQSKS